MSDVPDNNSSSGEDRIGYQLGDDGYDSMNNSSERSSSCSSGDSSSSSSGTSSGSSSGFGTCGTNSESEEDEEISSNSDGNDPPPIPYQLPKVSRHYKIPDVKGEEGVV